MKKYKPQIIIWRVRFIQLILLGFLLIILYKAFVIQIVQANKYQARSAKQKAFRNSTPLYRGEITDRQGLSLALDIVTYQIYLNPKKITKSSDLIKLHQLLNITEEDWQVIIDQEDTIKVLTSTDQKLIHQIKLLKEKAISIKSQYKRQYPQGTAAAHMLGFVNWSKAGQSGIEDTLNKYLDTKTNKNKYQVYRRIDRKPVYHQAKYGSILKTSLGMKVQLTVDSELQRHTDSVLQKYTDKFTPTKATAIVMKVKTGEIMSWANYPTYDPNKYATYDLHNLNQWSITESIEPGSTFKILTVASALETKSIKPDIHYTDTGVAKYNKDLIKNYDYYKKYERDLDLVKLFEHSSNTFSSHIANKIGAKKFYKSLKKLGITNKTNIELTGEVAGTLHPYEDWSALDLATTSFGQGMVAVTPIQLLASINTIPNQGKWVQPHIINKIYTHDNKTIKTIKSKSYRALSKKTANTVSELLIESTANGHKDNSHIAGNVKDALVAGKTGTAQKYCQSIKRYCPYQTIASYIGYFPYTDPEYIILVVFDAPKGGGGWGNTVAGPVFNDITKFIISDTQSE